MISRIFHREHRCRFEHETFVWSGPAIVASISRCKKCGKECREITPAGAQHVDAHMRAARARGETPDLAAVREAVEEGRAGYPFDPSKFGIQEDRS